MDGVHRQLLAGKERRFIELGKKIAEMSDFGEYRHGAVLVKGGSVINTSANKNSYAPYGNRFRKRDRGHATHHAELGCILGLDRSVTKGATIYVVRIGKRGDLKLSKPCDMCREVLRHVGVKKVVYTISDKLVGSYRTTSNE
jgi:tRNA(Arg) A34 adenosine deaminase TadA